MRSPARHAGSAADDRGELDPYEIVLTPLSPTYPEGTHLLTISRGNGAKDSASFVVAIYEEAEPSARGGTAWTRRPARAGGPAGPVGPAGATGSAGPTGPRSGRTSGTRRPRRSRGPARTGRAIWSGGTRGTAGPRGQCRAAGTARTAGGNRRHRRRGTDRTARTAGSDRTAGTGWHQRIRDRVEATGQPVGRQ